jgi:hypothetical protein
VLTQLDQSDLQFLSRLGTNPEFGPLHSIFSRELASHDAKCRTLDGPALYRAQGVSEWLVSFSKKVATAKEELERTARAPARQSPRAVSPPAESSGGIQ